SSRNTTPLITSLLRIRCDAVAFQRLFLFRHLAFPDIELVHRHRYAPMDQTFQCIDRTIKTGIQYFDLCFREHFQYIVCRILMRRRPANSDLDPHKLRCPDRVNARLDPVMSPMPTGLSDPKTPQIKIKIVMDENEVLSGQRKFTQEAFKRRTGDVHPIEGAGELEEFRPQPSRPSMNHAALGETDGPPGRGPFDDPHAGVVAGLGIGSARVAQPNDETQRYFFFSASFFSTFGGAAPFLSPPFASGAGAAAPALAGSTPSTGSPATLPFARPSGSFSPSGAAAALARSDSSLASLIGAATLTTICSGSSR